MLGRARDAPRSLEAAPGTPASNPSRSAGAGCPAPPMTRTQTRHSPQAPRPGPVPVPAGRGLLISELSTLGIACYCARRLWFETRFPPATWVIVVLAWLLAAAGFSIWRSAPGPVRFLRTALAAALCALVLKGMADPFSWRQAGAFGLMLAAALGLIRLVAGLIAGTREPGRWEGVRLGAAQGAALFAVHPYVRSALIGAGDASSYSLMVADFLAQVRAGIFPVFIGQSRFAFSGGFHPIRNAPYLQHLAWATDLLSLGTLNAFALLNLTVVASMLGAVLGCYAALRIAMPGGSWPALGLAILYGLCPGVLAPLYGGDMYPTFMTLPFIPWLVLGIMESAATPDRMGPWTLQGAALAAMWLAHPPVAAWATLLAGAAGLWTLVRERRLEVLGGMITAAALFIALSGYLFVSVHELRLPPVPRAAALATIDYKMGILHGDWLSSLLPVSRGGDNLLGDIQLGYGLWICLLVAAAGALRSSPARALSGCFALILLFAWPVPIVTRLAWSSLPTELLVVTNQWPTERFYVLLASLAVFIIGPAFSRHAAKGRWQRLSLAALLASACLWSASEAAKFFRRASATSLSEAASENLHRPENITLSRTHTYEYLGTPDYVSNGHMDPRLETRLLDRETRRAYADGSTRRPGSPGAVPGPRAVVLHGRTGGSYSGTIPLAPQTTSVARFDFLGRQPEGELRITGGALDNAYSLPASGSSRSFGSGPEAAHVLFLENSTKKPEEISFRFAGPSGAGNGVEFARIQVEPLGAEDRAVRVVSETPFRALVTADRDSYLETPRLFLPGYSASVDGAEAPIARSREGLVAIPLGRGEHDVRLAYPGSRLLRWSYYGSATAWLLLLVAVGAFCLRGEPFPEAWVPAVRRLPLISASLLSAALVVIAIGFLSRPGVFARAGHGAVHMSIRLPWPEFGRTEPLVTSGRTGAGDFIYITYVDGGHVIVGHDKWNFGGARSGPIAVDYDKTQEVEIGMTSLYGDAARDAHLSDPRLFVSWNGVQVLSEDVAAYPSAPNEVSVGENAIGGSSALPHFSGEVLSVARVDPTGAR